MKAVSLSRALALLSLAAAACSGGTKSLGARFNSPGALVPFVGGAPGAGARQFLAVANMLGDELRFVDPETDRVVMSLGVVFPLSVPTSPRPVQLVATNLGDRQPGDAKPDLMVVVGTGSLQLEVIKTWDDLSRARVEYAVDLEPLVAGPAADVLSLAAGPVPGVPGRARVFVGVSGSRMAVVEFFRAPDGSVQHDFNDPSMAIVQAIPCPLPIEPLDAAVGIDPADSTASQVVFATTDPVAQAGAAYVYGAVQVRVPASGAWSGFALDGRGPTRLVAAAVLKERSPIDPAQFTGFDGLRAYALLDPAPVVAGPLAPDLRPGCGVAAPINCGLVTFDLAAKGLVADDAGEQGYRAPIPVPFVATNGYPLRLSVALPPLLNADGSAGTTVPLYSAEATTAVLGLASTDGAIYFADLGRFTIPTSAASFVGGSPTTKVTIASASNTSTAVGIGLAVLPLDVLPVDLAAATVVTTDSSTIISNGVQVTPGYTQSDTWILAWRGVVPGLQVLPALIRQEGPDLTVAFQVPLDDPPTRWYAVANAYRPDLGVAPGDLVDFVVNSVTTPACAGSLLPDGLTVGFRATITAVNPPSPSAPGGSYVLSDAGCLAGENLAAGFTAATATVRSRGLILSGIAFGYAGRPTLNEAPPAAGPWTKVPYQLRWQPEDGRTSGLSEQEILVRKSRRWAYPPAKPCTYDATNAPSCDKGHGPNPWGPGPALMFVAAKVIPVTTPPLDPAADPADGSNIVFTTVAGYADATARSPRTGRAVPLGITALDRSVYPDHVGDGTVFYVSYEDQQILHIPQGGDGSTIVTIR